ncbi:MAG TPA: alpha/beta fold hydrolase [Deltaproteobacteria bacterium]|nr:alpha/beta fold hydrolase [Deltaproteobacteria bacterium]
MKALRTPDKYFLRLPGFDYIPNYLQVPDTEGGFLRVHYLDEGPKTAPPVLLMHGEPSWCYLYRKMIPVFTEADCRVIAPDLVGFGRSDKPSQLNDYTYQRHVDWMQSLLDQLNLTDITLVCQDWGGLIGLRLVAAHPERFARVVVANTGLPTGDHPMSDAFLAWREYSQTTPDFHVGRLVQRSCVNPLSDEIIAAYDAPFPDDTYKAGARIFPLLVPIGPADPAAEANRNAWQVLSRFEKPFITAFSDGDPVTQGGDKVFQKMIPGARNCPHTIIKGGGHFLQEDKGKEFALVVVDFINNYK